MEYQWEYTFNTACTLFGLYSSQVSCTEIEELSSSHFEKINVKMFFNLMIKAENAAREPGLSDRHLRVLHRGVPLLLAPPRQIRHRHTGKIDK